MLKVRLKSADRLDITCLEDLQTLVPAQFGGVALNYGQGEGQVRIADTVWGFYVCENDEYSFVFEEGVLDLDQATKMACAILDQVRARWGVVIRGELKGVRHDEPEMRMI